MMGVIDNLKTVATSMRSKDNQVSRNKVAAIGKQMNNNGWPEQVVKRGAQTAVKAFFDA